MTGPLRDGSPNRLPRVAGALYLVNILGGAFAIGVVPALLFTSEPGATAANIQAHELLYRSGLAAHLVVTVTNVPLALVFYELFEGVSRRLARLIAFFLLVGTAVEAAGLLDQFRPLVLLTGDSHATALPGPQLPALVQLSGDLSAVAYTIHTVFFAGYVLCLACVLLRSAVLPKTIGVLLAIDGLAYVVHTATELLAPASAGQLTPWINLPALLGEGSLCMWLLVVGIDPERRRARQAAARAEPAPARSG